MVKYKKIDAKTIKNFIYENKLIEKVLVQIGCGNIKYNKQKQYWTCSNSNGDNPTAIIVRDNSFLGVKNYTREKEFKDKSDIITLVQYNTKLPFRKAIDYLCDIVGVGDVTDVPEIEVKRSKKEIEEEDKEPIQSRITEEELQQYEPMLHIDWYRESIMPWTREKFDIRYSYDMKRIIIPVRHFETGELLAIEARTTIECADELGIPKYKVTEGYLKHLNIFGLYENRETIKEKGYVMVYEGAKSVFKRDTMNDATGVAIQGHLLSDEQAKILLDLDVDITISMDADVKIDEIRLMCSKLYKKNDRNVYYTIDGKGLLGEKDSIADKGDKVFQELFADRVLFDEKEYELFKESLKRSS